MAKRREENKKISKYTKKFTIVLTNYNAEQYIEQAITSIVNQTYDKIELIITDDASKNFSKNKLEKRIKNIKNSNIVDLKFIINKNNIGTVKTLNKTLKEITGEYVLFFASDDILADKNTIKNYVDLFDNNDNYNIITSNWILCDENLKIEKNFKSKNYLKKFNNKSVKRIFSSLCETNLFGAGSTCYKKKIFEKYSFDETYKYLEDWPLWLKLTRNGERIYYADFDGLLHRCGGISYNKNVSEVKKEFFKEVLYLYRNYILKNIDDLDNNSRVKIINSYLYSAKYYSKFFDVQKDYKVITNYINNDKKFKFSMYIYSIRPLFIIKYEELIKLNPSVPITFIINIIVDFLLVNIFKINNKYYLFLLVILLYIIIYYIVCTFLSIMASKRGKNNG